jgi:hypothetical protein
LTPYGYSTFGINGRLAWLLTHEYNHQVDAFYDRSGSVKYWLNHPEFTVHPGRFGQHFDCNAFILREWRDDEYFTNEFGKIILYDDKDGDGMPDEDATLPMDEKRFGSDPKKKNTDGDWLDDLGEFMAGIFSATDPTDPKSVRLYSCDPVILQTPMERPIELRSPNTVFPPGSDPSKAPAGSLGTVGITWSSGGLDLTFQLADSKPFRGQIDFDMDNDGWFTGHDNFEFGFDTANSSVRPPGASLTSSGSSFVFHIPASSLGVDTLQDGHMFGLRLRVEQDGKAVSAFDPWTLEPFYLR